MMQQPTDKIISLEKEIQELKHRLINSENSRLKLESQQDKNYNLFFKMKDEIEQSQNVTNREMDIAGNVHLKFLQQEAPKSDDWDIAYYFKPMWGVSGDFYDFYEIENKLHGLGIFDVSGHGIASGLVGIIAKSIIYRSFRDGLNKQLNAVLDDANDNLIKEIGDITIYLTGILLRFNQSNVEYVNAAHKQLLHKNKKNNSVTLVTDNGTPINGYFLGIDLFEHPYNLASFDVKSGGSLLLYTDCLSESHAFNDPHF